MGALLYGLIALMLGLAAFSLQTTHNPCRRAPTR